MWDNLVQIKKLQNFYVKDLTIQTKMYERTPIHKIDIVNVAIYQRAHLKLQK